MATVGVLSFSDGRDFAHEIVRPEIQATERALREMLEASGHEVVSADEPVWSNHHAVHEGRRLRAVNPDCVVFNFSAWAFPHFAMLAASEITSPLILMSNLDPARPGLVAMLAAAGGLDQVGRRYARVWGDIGDGDVHDRLEVQIAAAGAVSRLRGMTFGRIGGRPMGMYTATAGTDTWLARFGVDVEEIDQFELVRRAEEADPAEAQKGRRWLEENCRAVHYDGELLTPELLERQLRMYLAMRDLIDDLHFDFTGIKGQPELTSHFATADIAEAILNDPYDWNGAKAPHVCATEADMDGALTMQLFKLIAGTPVLFADVRHYHRDRGVWDLCNSGQHATWLAARSPDPERTCATSSSFRRSSISPPAAPPCTTSRRLASSRSLASRETTGSTECTCCTARPSVTTRPKTEALAEQSTRTWPHMFARLDATPEAFLGSYASNHIHGVPGDRRAELRTVCELLDVDCIEL